MATSDYDFLAGAVQNQEYKKSSWYQDQRTFARTERRCIKVYQRTNDMSHEDTLHALENVISLIVFSEHSYRFGVYKQWEADFLRHLLGYTTFEEERDFSDGCTLNFRLRDDHNSVEMRIGKKLTALLRHNSPLKNYMYPNGAVELSHVLDHCGKPVNAFEQCKFGRYFAAFIQGNNKQRYFVEVELKDDWFLSTDRLPWKIFIGCNQGHSTGIVRPIENSHKLTMVELHCFGWIFHVTDQRFAQSIQQNGLKRYNRDTLHFMYDNDGSDGCIRKGPGTKAPRQYESTRYCILKTQKLVHDGFDLFLTSNGVVLVYDDLPCEYFDCGWTSSHIWDTTLQQNKWTQFTT